jgi:phage-related protein
MVEWDVPARLETALGTLYFNDPTPGTFQSGYLPLVETECKATRGLRIASDNIPQGDGEIFHRRFRNGTEFHLVLQLWENESETACGQVRREMYEELVAHLNSLVNDPGRFIWQPSGYGDERMLESCRYAEPVDVSWPGGVPQIAFTIDSPLPYVIDKTQETVNITSGSTTNIQMPTFGADFYPVMKAHGSASVFWIINNDQFDEYGDPLAFYYDSTRPGGQVINSGHYAEIVTFNNTVYLDGHLANLQPGVLPDFTDYFTLGPGNNHIEVHGTTLDVLVNNAWSVD